MFNIIGFIIWGVLWVGGGGGAIVGFGVQCRWKRGYG